MDFMTPKFKINQTVVFNKTSGEPLYTKLGKVIGYSCYFPVMYIVQLDEPLDHKDFKGWTGVTAVGSMLNSME